MKTVSTVSDSASEELSTPQNLADALDTGFLPDNEHYRLTGEFEKPKAEKPEKAGASAVPSEETPAPASGQQEQDEASNAAPSASAQTQRTQKRESRWEKRERELKDARAEIARLKAQPSQTQQRSESAQAAQPATETAQTGKVAKPKIDDIDPKTNQLKFKTYAEYEDAKDAWLRQETIREFQEQSAKTQQLTQQQQAEREIGQSLTKKFAGPRAKYPDFDEVALSENLTIPKGSVTELFMLDSDHAGEVLYHLGQHPEILQGFYRDYDPKTGRFTSLITPQQQFRKLMAIEAELSGGSNGASRSSSARPITQASRPPHQVSGQGTVAKDAVEQALEDGDFETYQRTQNAKELARLNPKRK